MNHCPHQRAQSGAGGNVCFSHVNWNWMRGLPVQRSWFLLFVVPTFGFWESFVYHSVQIYNLFSCILQDDFPVQPMGQVQGAVQPLQQHL